MAETAPRRFRILALLLLLPPSARAVVTVTNCDFQEGVANNFLVCPRSAHTATLLPSGNILVAGGVSIKGGVQGVTDSYELDIEAKNRFVLWGVSSKMTVARSSHTATLLPNGKVLVTGGCSGTLCTAASGQVLKSAELYDPLANSWGAAGSGTDLNTVRYNHTATLLRNGLVLICGGQSNETGTGVSDCRLYNPGPGVNGGIAADSFAAGPSMFRGRAGHSAALLPDGRVLFQGGLDTSINATYPFPLYPSPYLNESEIYDPVSNSFTGAHELIQGRAYHTATVMGNGSVLVVGGYNGLEDRGSLGILETAEVYDPFSDSVREAAPICNTGNLASCVRVQAHSATLNPDGKVNLFNGLGNITTSFITANGVLQVGSTLGAITTKDTFPGVRPVSNGLDLGDTILPAEAIIDHSKSTLNLPVNGVLSAPVTGVVQGGTMTIQGTVNAPPNLNFNGGSAVFTAGTSDISDVGVTVLMNGTTVYCDAVTGTCGTFSRTYGVQNINGTMTYSQQNVTIPPANALTSANGCIDFGNLAVPAPIASGQVAPINSAGPFCQTTCPVDADNPGRTQINCFTANFTISGLPFDYVGATIASGTIAISGGQITAHATDALNSTSGFDYTVSLTTAYLKVPSPLSNPAGGPISIVADPLNPLKNALATFTGTLRYMSGTVSVTTTTAVDTPLYAGPAPGGFTCNAQTCASGGTDCSGPHLNIGSKPATDSKNGCEITPLTLTAANLSGVMNVIPTKVNVADPNNPTTFTGGNAVVSIKAMAFGDIHQYDPTADAWNFQTNLSNVANQRVGAAVTELPTGVSRVFGGLGCDYNSTTCKTMMPRGSDFDHSRAPLGSPLATEDVLLSTGTGWALEPLFPTPLLVASLATARANHTATPLPNGTVLIAGGNNGPLSLKSAELFNPGLAQFTQTGSMASSRDLHTATLLPNGRVLVAGGFTTTNGSSSTASAELYYPDTGIWIPTSSMNVRRDQHTATLLPDGNVLVAGGYNSQEGYLSSLEIYYSTAGVWHSLGCPAGTSAPDCAGVPVNSGLFLLKAPGTANPIARNTATLLLDGEVLFIGGINGSGNSATVAAYNPTAAAGLCAAGTVCALTLDPITSAPPVAAFGNVNPVAISLHTATLLQGGSVLIAGGDDGSSEGSSQSMVFDPTQAPGKRWTMTRPLVLGKMSHTATLLPTGLVLVSGGITATLNATSDTELYDPGLSVWSAIPALATARAYHTATTLGNGKIYFIGGVKGNSYVSAAETVNFTGVDQQTQGFPPSIRVSSIAFIDQFISSINVVSFNYGSTVTFAGFNFGGFTQAGGGGAASADSAFYQPRLFLQAVDAQGGTSSQGSSGFAIDLSTRIYSSNGNAIFAGLGADQLNSWTNINAVGAAFTHPGSTLNGVYASSMTIKMPDCAAGVPCEKTLLPTGWYVARMAHAGLFSQGTFVQVGPPHISTWVAPIIASVSSSTAVTFSWQPVAGADGYNLYTSSNGVWVTSLTAVTLSYTQGSLLPNTTAQVTVAPFNIMGDGPSVTSTATFTLSTSPINVQATSVTANGLVLTWDAHTNTPGTTYEVSFASVTHTTAPVNGFWSTPFADFISTPTAFIPPLTTTFLQITGLQLNTTYFFRVRAANNAGLFSSFSAYASTATRAPVTNIVATPCAGAPATCINWTWFDLGQNGISPIHYNVYTSTGVAGTTAGLLTPVPLSANAYQDSGLLPNSTRQILVTAITSAGEGIPTPSPVTFTQAAPAGHAGTPYDPVIISSGVLTPLWTRGDPPLFNPLQTVYQVSLGSSSSNISTFFVTDTGGTSLSVSIGGLIPAEIYKATVTALNSATPQQAAAPLFLGLKSTYANRPSTITLLSASPSSIAVSWDNNGNASTATYELIFSSNNFATPWSTAVYFTDRNNFLDSSHLGTTITGLLTNQAYELQVFARNADGFVVGPTSTTITTSGGGAVAGSFTQVITNPNIDNDISGTVSTTNPRAVTLHVPGGAFPSQVTVTVSSFTNIPALCPRTTNIAVTIITVPPFQPVKPLTLQIGFSPGELGSFNTSQFTLFRYDPVTAKCLPFITSVDTVDGVINAQINHFTTFVFGAFTPSSTVQSARIFPNPFFPATDGFVTFENLTPYARVRIWTEKGEAIYDRQANGAGLLTWPGINKAGRYVASGTYFVTFESLGFTEPRKIMKVVLIR